MRGCLLPALAFVTACSRPAPPGAPPDVEALPSGDAAVDAATAVSSAPPPPPTAADASLGTEDCLGAEIDLRRALRNPACTLHRPPPEPSVRELASKLRVRLETRRTVVAPGEDLTLTVSFENTTDAPLPLTFRSTMVEFAVYAFDASGIYLAPEGRRACPIFRALARFAKIVLLPHGIARAAAPWQASSFRWTYPNERSSFELELCHVLPTTPLPEGRYDLQVTTPLFGGPQGWKIRADESGTPLPPSPDAGFAAAPTTSIEVRRTAR